jgi:hypothetical protein
VENVTRRAAILATIAAIPAATQSVPQVLSKGETTVFSIEFQSGPKYSGVPRECKPSSPSGYLVNCFFDMIQEPKYVLTVKYGDRVAHITASELMDALEGK